MARTITEFDFKGKTYIRELWAKGSVRRVKVYRKPNMTLAAIREIRK